MIVRRFLQWVRTAGAAERAEATSALARAYLYSELSPDDRAACEGALIMLLDDPSPLVRIALAQALAFSEYAPLAVILGLAGDQHEVAGWVLQHSPLLVDADLVDAVATGGTGAQLAIANREGLPPAVAAAVAEVGAAEACLVLIENPSAEIAPLSLDRMVERHGHLAAIREAMLARADLPAPTRQALVAKLSETLAGFVTSRDWLQSERAKRIAKDACEKATVTLAAISPRGEVQPLIEHLRVSGQLNAGLLLRALLSGNVALFEHALADLAGLPLARVSALVHDRRSSGLRALYERAGLPASTYTAFHEAIEAMREVGFADGAGGAIRLRRRVVERVLARCADGTIEDVEPLLTLLRRFAAEAAREEARVFCEELVAHNIVADDAMPDDQQAYDQMAYDEMARGEIANQEIAHQEIVCHEIAHHEMGGDEMASNEMDYDRLEPAERMAEEGLYDEAERATDGELAPHGEPVMAADVRLELPDEPACANDRLDLTCEAQAPVGDGLAWLNKAGTAANEEREISYEKEQAALQEPEPLSESQSESQSEPERAAA
jgi:uncharacterized protein (DUF2336 family)